MHKCCFAYWALGTTNMCPLCRSDSHVVGPISEIVARLNRTVQADMMQQQHIAHQKRLLQIAMVVDCLIYLIECARQHIAKQQGGGSSQADQFFNKLKKRWKQQHPSENNQFAGTLEGLVLALTYLPFASTKTKIINRILGTIIIGLVPTLPYKPDLILEALIFLLFLAISRVEQKAATDADIQALAAQTSPDVSQHIRSFFLRNKFNKVILKKTAKAVLENHISLFPDPS